LPVFAYIVLDAGRDKNIISTAQAVDKPSVIIFTSTMCADCQKMKKVIAIVEPNYKVSLDNIDNFL
jgi:thioredoxin-related protein